MTVVLVGLNHHTAPIAVREGLSVTGPRLRGALESMGSSKAVLLEGTILSTCNRLEAYAVAPDAARGRVALRQFLARLGETPAAALAPHLYCLEGRGAVQHLMRVAAGLDSLILGESQILGQVARAGDEAREAGTAGPVLSKLFMRAVHAGKRVRTETAIGRHTTSVSHAAVGLAKASAGDLSRARALVVGAGEMAGLAGRALREHGVLEIACLNRTAARAEALAHRLGGSAFAWEALPEALAWADVVISATGAPQAVIGVGDVAPGLARRGARPLWIVDVAVPRDVEVAVGDLPGLHRFDVDDLRSVLDAGLAERRAAAPAAEEIVREEVAHFLRWAESRQVVPVIADLRRRAKQLADAEVVQALNQLESLDQRGQRVVTRLAHRIVNKLLHDPTEGLKLQASRGDTALYAQAVRELFALGAAGEGVSHA
ncbi:MAG TPA: glutamyl-tRNA reductase [Chloroflexota bacterium]|nr:glutamyl-tRNA reductase [Chloroflexota bacterium]